MATTSSRGAPPSATTTPLNRLNSSSVEERSNGPPPRNGMIRSCGRQATPGLGSAPQETAVDQGATQTDRSTAPSNWPMAADTETTRLIASGSQVALRWIILIHLGRGAVIDQSPSAASAPVICQMFCRPASPAGRQKYARSGLGSTQSPEDHGVLEPIDHIGGAAEQRQCAGQLGIGHLRVAYRYEHLQVASLAVSLSLIASR